MPGSSKVIVLDPDPRAGRQLQLGFEREGITATITPVGVDLGKLAVAADDAGLIVVGGLDGRGLELLKRTRELLDGAGHDLPIVFSGRGVRRSEAEMAGADEILLAPTHLRDVVTIARMLHGVPAHQRAHVVGSLAETTGVYTLVRALAAIGRSAVLTLIRGLRRGEVRFYHGEVTSAQVGMIHGQAALHQLLLWTDARFDFRHEDVVRRQQIPLEHDELFADAERFLQGVRDSAGKLSPAMVLEQDIARVQSLGKQIPTEVHGVLRMFDGHRVLADVLEDSPYRVFETLRVAQRAMEAGLLRVAVSLRPKATWRAVLAIEEWLVGTETRDGVVDRTASMLESEPVAASASGPIKQTGQSQPYSQTKGRKKRKKKRVNTPVPGTVPVVASGATATANKQDIDWGALVPRTVGAEVGPLAGVVPAFKQSGEIVSRREAREGLEAVTDTATRAKLFATDADAEAMPEPTVVWDEVAERAQLAAEAAAKAAAATAETEKADAAKAELDAKQARIKELVERQRRELEEKAAADASAKQAQLEQERIAQAIAATKRKTAEELEAKAKAAAALAKAKTEAETLLAQAKRDHEREVADEAKRAAEVAEQDRRDAETLATNKAAAKLAADAAAIERAKLEAEVAAAAKVAAEAAKLAKTRADAEAADKAKAVAEQVAAAKALADANAGAVIAKAKLDAEAAEKAARVKAEADAADKAKADTAAIAVIAKAKAEAEIAAAAKRKADADARAAADAEAAATVAAAKAAAEARSAALLSPSAADLVKQILADGANAGDVSHRVTLTDPLVLVETSTKTVVTSDKLTVVAGNDTAVVTATPVVTVTAAPVAAAPQAVVDEPSDGVIQGPLATQETAPLARQRRASQPPPEGYAPPQPEQRGEIRPRTHNEADAKPAADQPSILVADLAAAQQAIAAVTNAQARAPATADATSKPRDAAVAEVRKDAAVAFSDAEEAFFRGHDDKSAPVVRVPPAESFDDLDEGYQPVSFWDRLRGRGRRHSVTSDPPLKKK